MACSAASRPGPDGSSSAAVLKSVIAAPRRPSFHSIRPRRYTASALSGSARTTASSAASSSSASITADRQRFSGKCVNKAAGSRIVDSHTRRRSITLNLMIGPESHIEAMDHLMKRAVHIVHLDTLQLMLIVLIEVRLTRLHFIVLVHTNSIHP